MPGVVVEPIAGQHTSKGQRGNDNVGSKEALWAIAGPGLFALNVSFVDFLCCVLTEQEGPQCTGKAVIKHVVGSHVGCTKDFSNDQNLQYRSTAVSIWKA